MSILIAEVIRGFSQILAYKKETDPLYKKLKTKNLKGGFPSLETLIDTRITGWKQQGKPDGVNLFKELKEHVKEDHPEPALLLYEEKIIPFLEKEHGPTK